MPKRQIPKNYRNVTGILGGSKSHEEAQFESTLEQDFLILLEHDPNVSKYEVQPVTINFLNSKGNKRKYTPDVLVEYSSGKCVLFEVKFHDELSAARHLLIDKIRAAIAFSRSKGWTYKIVTEKMIRTHYLHNIRFLQRYKSHPINDPMAKQVEETLYRLKETTPEILIKTLVHDKWNQAKVLFILWQMLSQGYILTDLSTPITMTNPIWLSEATNEKYA